MRFSWAASLLLIGTIGCVDFTPPLVPPGRGGPPWTELTSRHFVLMTDLAAPEARRALSEFEVYYGALVQNTFPGDHLGGDRIRIIWFARAIDFRQFETPGVEGFSAAALRNDPEPQPTVALHGAFTEATRSVFLHELTHHLVVRAFRVPPPWLNEGLALYYSTLRIEDDSVHLGLPLPTLPLFRGVATPMMARQGRAHVPVTPGIRLSDLPSPADLIRLDRRAFYGFQGKTEYDGLRAVTGHYAGAWAFVHMLHHGDAGYRRRYAKFIAAATGGERASQAWTAAFGDVPVDVLKDDFYTYLAPVVAPSELRPHVQAAEGRLERERPMTAAEVHLLWARLRSWQVEAGDQAKRDIENAVASAHTSPEPRFWRALFHARRGNARQADDDFYAALELDPENPRYLFGYAVALSTRIKAVNPRAPENRARALTLRRLTSVVDRLSRTATSAYQLEFVARFDQFIGNDDTGVAFAERSTQRDPSCRRCWNTYANLLSLVHRHEEAMLAKQRAIDLAHDDDDTRADHDQLLCFTDAASRSIQMRIVPGRCVHGRR